MELYQIHTKILTPFMNETVSALKTMASVEGKVGKSKLESVENFAFRGFAVAVVAKTTGSIEGKILMHYSNDVAYKIGKRVLASMMGEEPEATSMTEEITEAVTEFANTIIGLATRTLSQSNLQIKFTPPIFIRDNHDMEALLDGVKEIMTVPINVPDIGEFSFSYLLHKSVG